jgi:N,N'-diacetyllegionaminate synthase
MAAGCVILEKHVCLDRNTAPYDGSAALEPREIEELQNDLELARLCFGDQFIAEAETAYLQKTLQRPVARHALRKGQLVAREDLLFRRTNKPGLAMSELDALQGSFEILDKPVESGAPLFTTDFREAHIATLVAGRMKSTRLRQKAVLPVAGVPSVDRCLQTCLTLPYVRTVVLATSTAPEDDILESHQLGGRVGFFRGDPDNVVERFLGACAKYDIDVIVRGTADCLTISPEITKILLEEHFASGADYTRARNETPGIAPQIFNVETLRRIDDLSGGARYSEYMNQYVEHNPRHFKIHWVDLPEELVRPYRLTLDYPEDLHMYDALFGELSRQGKPTTTRDVFSILDARPDIASLNSHIAQVYLQDPKLIEELKAATTFKE